MKHEYDYTSVDIPDSHGLGLRARRKSSTTLAVPPADIQRRTLPPINTSFEASKPRLACPYYKFSPSCAHKRKSCVSPGFGDISRLKEHLKRYHMRPAYACPRCSQSFEKELDQQEHLRATELCVLRQIPERDYGDGYDAEQAERLKHRKRKQRQEDKWQDIYKILFPHDHRRPSPYCHDKLEDYRNFFRGGLSRVLYERLGGSSRDVSSSLGHARNLNLEDLMQDVHEQLFGEFQALYEDEDGGLSRSMTSTPASTCPPTPCSVMDDPPSPMEEDTPARPQKRKRSDAAESETTTPTTVDTVGDSIHNAVATQADHVQPPIDIVVSSDSAPLQMADETMEETSYYGFPGVSDNYSDMVMSCLDGSPATALYYAQNHNDFSQPDGGAGDFNFSFPPF